MYSLSTVNIHPVLVHFPVAFLSVYAICELLRFKKLNDQPAWFYIKALLLFAGLLGAAAATLTGPIAAQYHQDVRDLVHTHETFAHLTDVIFFILGVNYFLIIVDRYMRYKNVAQERLQAWNALMKIRAEIFVPSVVVLLALLGLVSVVTTGTLGGTIEYGPNNDPFTHFVNKLLFPPQ